MSRLVTAPVPALVEIIVERETDAAMGKSIDNVSEYEPVEEGDGDLAGQLADNIPERDRGEWSKGT